jgi:hypothetical protein
MIPYGKANSGDSPNRILTIVVSTEIENNVRHFATAMHPARAKREIVPARKVRETVYRSFEAATRHVYRYESAAMKRGAVPRPTRQPGKTNPEAATELAAQILSWLAGDPERLCRFLDVTGLTPASIRAAASEPHFLASVLEYLLQDEALLVAFAQQAGLEPTAVEQARHALAGAAWERETP